MDIMEAQNTIYYNICGVPPYDHRVIIVSLVTLIFDRRPAQRL